MRLPSARAEVPVIPVSRGAPTAWQLAVRKAPHTPAAQKCLKFRFRIVARIVLQWPALAALSQGCRLNSAQSSASAIFNRAGRFEFAMQAGYAPIPCAAIVIASGIALPSNPWIIIGNTGR